MSRYDDRSRSPVTRHRSRDHDVEADRGHRLDRSNYRKPQNPDVNERPRRRRQRSHSSDSEPEHDRRERYRDRSPCRSHHKSRRHSRSASPKPYERSRGPLPSQDRAFKQERGSETPTIEKQKPNFAPSGKLAAASNTVQTAGQTVVLKYHEPAEARKPPARDAWRMYIFKNDEIVDTVQLFEQSCWLFGREMAVVDIPIEHPSCSKQHAVIQFRYSEKRNEFGDKIGKVKPYVLDLESSNGTFINEQRIPDAKYVEVKDKDVIKFGDSRREYVVQLPKT
ncbi:hypothetical protein LTS08_008295 [Lithohypha guttulata]|nr:hypothetical protein LTS08_008295 [Lithohypha guttulata]